MKKIVSLLCLLEVLTSSCLFAQDKKVPVEPSEERMNSQHQPEKLMDAIGLKEGMTIADIGAGRGRMTVFFASKVGETGKVYANDIDEESLEYLEHRCQSNNMTNVFTFPGKVDNPMFPASEVDIAFMVSTYHHLEKPVEMLRNTIPCLKNDGILVIVERDPVKTGQSGSESTSGEKMTREATEAGYELIKINKDLLERDNIYFFRVKRK
ncbi:MAG: methyltransferase domain-containing protein [Bacteroidales bacterium]|nr:methyltransferase domain-containing protein [Bacteroidales bacterium]